MQVIFRLLNDDQYRTFWGTLIKVVEKQGEKMEAFSEMDKQCTEKNLFGKLIEKRRK